MYTYAQSLGNSQDELETIPGTASYDMVGATETWWDDLIRKISLLLIALLLLEAPLQFHS